MKSFAEILNEKLENLQAAENNTVDFVTTIRPQSSGPTIDINQLLQNNEVNLSDFSLNFTPLAKASPFYKYESSKDFKAKKSQIDEDDFSSAMNSKASSSTTESSPQDKQDQRQSTKCSKTNTRTKRNNKKPTQFKLIDSKKLNPSQKKAHQQLNVFSGYELPSRFSQAQLKKTYKRLVFQWHPDRLNEEEIKKTPEGASNRFNEIVKAYNSLNLLF